MYKNLEKIKMWVGIVMIALSIIAGLIFLLEVTGIFTESGLSYRYLKELDKFSERLEINIIATQTPIYFGLVGVVGVWLLLSIRKQ